MPPPRAAREGATASCDLSRRDAHTSAIRARSPLPSQVTYIYHFHRDEYAWRWFIPDQDNGQPLDRAALRSHTFPGVTHDFSYLDVDDETTRHWPRTWAHWCVCVSLLCGWRAPLRLACARAPSLLT